MPEYSLALCGSELNVRHSDVERPRQPGNVTYSTSISCIVSTDAIQLEETIETKKTLFGFFFYRENLVIQSHFVYRLLQLLFPLIHQVYQVLSNIKL